ncbi:hypothetical protein IMSAGC005_03739 [Lachnospiraceae bacterium]|nr:hypothetical protein IMSAGC005_03739 [Lachnospiraceae bacterium]
MSLPAAAAFSVDARFNLTVLQVTTLSTSSLTLFAIWYASSFPPNKVSRVIFRERDKSPSSTLSRSLIPSEISDMPDTVAKEPVAATMPTATAGVAAPAVAAMTATQATATTTARIPPAIFDFAAASFASSCIL